MKSKTSKQHIQREKDRADPTKAIVLLSDGLSYQQIAEILLLMEPQSDATKKNSKQAALMFCLTDDRYHGSIGKLTSSQEFELTGYLKTHLHHTAKEIRLHIEKHTAYTTRMRESPNSSTG